MSTLRIAVTTVAACVLSVGSAAAQYDTNSDGHTVSFEVAAVSQIVVSGAPSLLITGAPVTGDTLAVAADASSSYAITTNGTNKKITAELSADMPADVRLFVEVEAPSTGASTGQQELSTEAVNVVTSIDPVHESGLGITYTLQALVTAGPVAAGNRTVTFTIID